MEPGRLPPAGRAGRPLTRPTRSSRGDPAIVGTVEENEARKVVDTLRQRGVDARMEKAGVYQFGVLVALPDGRQAVWDSDGTAGLEAQVMRDGMLVGFVPEIEGSADFDLDQTVDVIVRTDYDRPVARQRAEAPPPAAPLPRQGGVFRRFFGGFRER